MVDHSLDLYPDHPCNSAEVVEGERIYSSSNQLLNYTSCRTTSSRYNMLSAINSNNQPSAIGNHLQASVTSSTINIDDSCTDGSSQDSLSDLYSNAAPVTTYCRAGLDTTSGKAFTSNKHSTPPQSPSQRLRTVLLSPAGQSANKLAAATTSISSRSSGHPNSIAQPSPGIASIPKSLIISSTTNDSLHYQHHQQQSSLMRRHSHDLGDHHHPSSSLSTTTPSCQSIHLVNNRVVSPDFPLGKQQQHMSANSPTSSLHRPSCCLPMKKRRLDWWVNNNSEEASYSTAFGAGPSSVAGDSNAIAPPLSHTTPQPPLTSTFDVTKGQHPSSLGAHNGSFLYSNLPTSSQPHPNSSTALPSGIRRRHSFETGSLAPPPPTTSPMLSVSMLPGVASGGHPPASLQRRHHELNRSLYSTGVSSSSSLLDSMVSSASNALPLDVNQLIAAASRKLSLPSKIQPSFDQPLPPSVCKTSPDQLTQNTSSDFGSLRSRRDLESSDAAQILMVLSASSRTGDHSEVSEANQHNYSHIKSSSKSAASFPMLLISASSSANAVELAAAAAAATGVPFNTSLIPVPVQVRTVGRYDGDTDGDTSPNSSCSSASSSVSCLSFPSSPNSPVLGRIQTSGGQQLVLSVVPQQQQQNGGGSSSFRKLTSPGFLVKSTSPSGPFLLRHQQLGR